MAKVPKSKAHIVKPNEIVSDSGIYRSSISKELRAMVAGETAPSTKQKDELWIQAYNTNPNE